MGIPGDFPQEAIRVGEIAGVTSPESLSSGFDEGGARGQRFLKHLIHFLGRADVVGQRESTKAAPFGGHLCVFRQSVSPVQCQPRA